MQVTIMGDSWAKGCWRESEGHMQVYHTGINQLFDNRGDSVTTLAQGGSHNHTQWQRLAEHDSARQSDLIVWLWTDTLRGYDWWQHHAPTECNLYQQQIQQEQWIQAQISAQTDLKWHQFVIIGGNAPLLTDWPCVHLKSWCAEMAYIDQDHATIDPVNWRDFVNWCNGKNTVGPRDYADSPQFNHVHQMWYEFIRSFSHEHKQHHMDYLQRSQDRQSLLVNGADHKQLNLGMMGEDLHPNLKAHKWLIQWILDTLQEQTDKQT